MEVALVVKTVMIVLVVADCGAVPAASTGQEEISKAQVNMKCFSVSKCCIACWW